MNKHQTNNHTEAEADEDEPKFTTHSSEAVNLVQFKRFCPCSKVDFIVPLIQIKLPKRQFNVPEIGYKVEAAPPYHRSQSARLCIEETVLGRRLMVDDDDFLFICCFCITCACDRFVAII